MHHLVAIVKVSKGNQLNYCIVTLVIQVLRDSHLIYPHFFHLLQPTVFSKQSLLITASGTQVLVLPLATCPILGMLAVHAYTRTGMLIK